MFAFAYNFFMRLSYEIPKTLMIKAPENYQWILAAMVPFIREFHLWVQRKMTHQSADAKDSSVAISIEYNVNTHHCVFLSVVLGTVATDVSSWIILGMDFAFNAYLAIKLIWIKNRRCSNDKNDQEMFRLLWTLIVVEFLEVAIPLTFLVCFLMAYYGPNAELIAGVKGTHFNATPVNDINHFIANLLLLVFVDIIGSILVSLSLWTFCKINIFRAFMAIQEEFWSVILITSSLSIFLVSITNILKIVYLN